MEQERLDSILELQGFIQSKDEAKIKEVRDKMRGFSEKIESALTDHSNFTGVAFVTLDEETNKDKLIDQNNKDLWEKVLSRGVYQPLVA